MTHPDRLAARALDVGFLCQGWSPDSGGVETHTLELARGLVARGHRVQVLCLDRRPDREQYTLTDEVQQGVGVRRVAYRDHDHRALADLVRHAELEDRVLAWMAERPCDVIHVHHLTGWGAGALRAIADTAQPLLVSLHDFWLLCPRGQMWRVDGVRCESIDAAVCARCLAATWPRLLPSGGGERRGCDGESVDDDLSAVRSRTTFALSCLGLAARVLVPSASTLRIAQAAGVPLDRLHLRPYALEAAALRASVAAARSPQKPRDGRLVLGVLGAWFPSKGQVDLAEVFVELGSEVEGLVLELHGPAWSYHGDRSHLLRLEELARADPRLRLLGPYGPGELPRVLARLDGVAVPSRWNETFGLVAHEARAAGLAVLASDVGALTDLAGQGAALVRPDDRAAWRAALVRFARDAAWREELALPVYRARPTAELALQIEGDYIEVIDAAHACPSRAAAEPPGLAGGWLGRLFRRRRS